MNRLMMTPYAVVRRRLLAPAAALAGRPLGSPIAGRTVMITGASSGIGAATARKVAERGGIAVLVARRADELAEVAAEIESAGGVAHTYACDLTDQSAVDALVADVLAERGTVDMLVNNAGRSIRRSLEHSADRLHDFERTMAINYIAPVQLILGVLPAMRAQRSGHVVNVVTWGVQLKAPKFAAYIASKTALDSFSRIAGRETWHDNVTFTNIRLSLVRTDMITATEAYRSAPAMTPDKAADRVIRALEDKPLTMGTTVSNLGEVLNLIAPRLSDAVMAQAHRRFPDSEAARSGR